MFGPAFMPDVDEPESPSGAKPAPPAVKAPGLFDDEEDVLRLVTHAPRTC